MFRRNVFKLLATPKPSSKPSTTKPRSATSTEPQASTMMKVSTGAAAAGVVSMTTLTSFHFAVCPVTPMIFGSTFVAAVFSGAFASIESGGKDGTSFGCIIGMVMGMIAAYFAKTSAEPWRS
eukprot:PhF_6_TR4294/c0_g1_i1/m.5794